MSDTNKKLHDKKPVVRTEMMEWIRRCKKVTVIFGRFKSPKANNDGS